MTFTSDFWINLVYFLSQTLLGLVGIWIGIYLYFRQEKKEQDKRYDKILEHLEHIDRQILQFEGKIEKVDGATLMIQNELIGTQRDVIYHLTGAEPVRQSLSDKDLPIVKKGRKKILTNSDLLSSAITQLPNDKR